MQAGSGRANGLTLAGANLATSIKIKKKKKTSDPVIPVLGIHPTDTHIHVPRNTHILTAAIFVISIL